MESTGLYLEAKLVDPRGVMMVPMMCRGSCRDVQI